MTGTVDVSWGKPLIFFFFFIVRAIVSAAVHGTDPLVHRPSQVASPPPPPPHEGDSPPFEQVFRTEIQRCMKFFSFYPWLVFSRQVQMRPSPDILMFAKQKENFRLSLGFRLLIYFIFKCFFILSIPFSVFSRNETQPSLDRSRAHCFGWLCQTQVCIIVCISYLNFMSYDLSFYLQSQFIYWLLM